MAQVDFGILGPLERDSGHQVRRMGEEGLFQLLKEQNQKTFEAIKFQRIVTTDPHSFNTLKNDYQLKVPVYHYSEYFLELFKTGRLSKKGVPKGGRYTYHDPCYLGRHNGIYEAPREILEEILGVKLVEMKRSREKSFCCGGADVSLWHEVKEEERMAQKRIGMALEVGADRIVTACPFCLMHLEDAIKTMGLEGKIQVLDLMELIISVC
jgi:Fe-S oxidoreductase